MSARMNRELRESVQLDAKVTVDRQAGIIRGVKLLGENGNCDYPLSTRQKAISLLEGRRIYADHAPRGSKEPRSYRDALGVTCDVREGGDGLYGDVRFNPKHPLAEQLAWDAQHAPHLLGFSITGDGDKRREGKRIICEAITRLDSCDLVTSPAHGGGLFEGRTVKKKISELRESLKKSRPGYARALREMSDPESGIMSDDDMMDVPDEPVEPVETLDAGADHEQALLDAAKQVLDSDLSSKEKVKKIQAILKIVDGGGGGGGGTDTETDDDPPFEKTEEGRRKKAGNLRETLEIDALRQLGRKGVKLTPLVEKAVKGCESAAEVRELVESLGGDTPDSRRQTPRSSTPTREHQGEKLRESKTAETQTPDPVAQRKALVEKARRTR